MGQVTWRGAIVCFLRCKWYGVRRGWWLCRDLWHDETSGESNFIAMDAKSLNLDIVANVKLPRRVPWGFHSLFLNQNNLSNNW
jgi:9-cis-epoxycarotenoid dioxygenase